MVKWPAEAELTSKGRHIISDTQPITLEQAVKLVVDELDGPTPVTEVVCRVLAIRPSKSKRPEQQVRNHLSGRWDKS